MLTMDAAQWQFRFGGGMPAHPDPFAWAFTFPQAGAEVDYLTTTYSGPAPSVKVKVVYRVDVLSGAPVFHAHDAGPVMATIILQRRGDDLVGEDGRWWAEGARLPLDRFGVFLPITAKLTDLHVWRNVQGHYATDRPSQFAACLTNLANVGVTFGAQAFGHGIWCDPGSARFEMQQFVVQ